MTAHHLFTMTENSPADEKPTVEEVIDSLKREGIFFFADCDYEPRSVVSDEGQPSDRSTELDFLLSASLSYSRVFYGVSESMSVVSGDTASGGSRPRSKSLRWVQISL